MTATGPEARLPSKPEFDRLDPAEEVEVADDGGYGGGYGQAEAVQGYGNVGGMGVGASASGMGLGHRAPTVRGSSDLVRLRLAPFIPGG